MGMGRGGQSRASVKEVKLAEFQNWQVSMSHGGEKGREQEVRGEGDPMFAVLMAG
jgi:hypothetical protein